MKLESNWTKGERIYDKDKDFANNSALTGRRGERRYIQTTDFGKTD